MIDYGKIRPDIIESLKRYIDHGVPPGGFLEAMVSNDLREAAARADEDNQQCLFEICAWLHNNAPIGCWGNPTNYKDWLNWHADRRKKELENAQP